ncbi:uncharacterized protein LOC125011411 [Mugil cephalus]|uniref:uncharacterized protein LOC125011411 n=1 Tax=Mugil cephalus TaxID=48193 RepID=UPI001FB6056E|nr:uncharacterized protein LOC125011411 [Mugil cephalus]
MVTVQGPVSPVDLNPDSVSISSDSCNLTVTCSTEDSHINSTFTCDTKTCSQEGGDQSKVTNSGASLRVHLLNGTIICNHSNQVSWTQKKTQIQDLCLLHAGPEPLHNLNITIVIVVIPVIAVVVSMMLLGCYCRHKRRKHDRENIQTTEVDNSCFLNEDEDSANNLTSTYCLVGPHTGPRGSTKTKTNNQPESLYAMVDKAPSS